MKCQLNPKKGKWKKKNEKVIKPVKRAALAMCKESGQTKSLEYDKMINFGNTGIKIQLSLLQYWSKDPALSD